MVSDAARGRAADRKAPAVTRTDQASTDPGRIGATGPPGGIPVGRLQVTLAEDGPRRTVLDVVAAGCTAVAGESSALAERLLGAAGELAAQLCSGAGGLVLVGLPGRLPGEAAAGSVWRADDCSEALGLLPGLPTPLAVVVGPAAMGDEAAVGALAGAAGARPGTGLLLGGPWAGAHEQIGESCGEPLARGEQARGPARSRPLGGGRASSRPLPDEPPASPAVAVNVLGPVLVAGVPGGLVRHPKLSELAVYLSVHPEGAPSRVWSVALWPDRKVPAQTIANRLSELRRLLGFAPDGRPRLRRDGDWHRLVDVGSDWGRLSALADPGAGPASWREALELVRGTPFGGLREASWTRVEGHEGEIEQIVVDCALRLSAELLAGGDPAGASWAAQQGLKAVPWDERLHRALMRAGAAAGNRGQVEATLRHLALALDLEGDPLGAVHPETARLYTQLSGRGSRSPGSVPTSNGRR